MCVKLLKILERELISLMTFTDFPGIQRPPSGGETGFSDCHQFPPNSTILGFVNAIKPNRVDQLQSTPNSEFQNSDPTFCDVVEEVNKDTPKTWTAG